MEVQRLYIVHHVCFICTVVLSNILVSTTCDLRAGKLFSCNIHVHVSSMFGHIRMPMSVCDCMCAYEWCVCVCVCVYTWVFEFILIALVFPPVLYVKFVCEDLSGCLISIGMPERRPLLPGQTLSLSPGLGPAWAPSHLC